MDWTQEEDELIVADYFAMLTKELAGERINKAEHNRNIRKFIARPRGAVEWKYQNISAVLVDLGMPYINGYKPASRYQKALVDVVNAYRRAHPELEILFDQFASKPVKVDTLKLDFAKILEDLPKPRSGVKEPTLSYGRAVKVNYLEREQRNQIVGKSGEEIALEFERWRLIKAGKESLADKVEWVSQTQGDGLGFDIRSWSENGKDRFIEVKSTKLTKEAPIFFTNAEYTFARDHRDRFYLYRVFNLQKEPRLFMVKGAYDEFCRPTPIQYKGYF